MRRFRELRQANSVSHSLVLLTLLCLSCCLLRFLTFRLSSSSLCFCADFATFQQPAAKTLRHPIITSRPCCQEHNVKFPGKGQEHTVLWSDVTSCFINCNEGAAEVSEPKCAAGGNLFLCLGSLGQGSDYYIDMGGKHPHLNIQMCNLLCHDRQPCTAVQNNHLQM